jgi:lysophospholipase L1-like esterase
MVRKTIVSVFSSLGFLGIAGLTCVAWPTLARGQVTVSGVSSTANQSYFDGTILTNNLGTQATLSGTTPSLGSLGGLVDGEGSPTGVGNTNGDLSADAYFDGYGSFGTPNELASTPSVTFTFNTTATGNPAGYTISSISSVYGWHDHASFSDQDYSIAYSTVSNPTTFTTLTTVAYNPFDPANDNANAGAQYNSSLVTVARSTGSLATSVAALKFTFTAYHDTGGMEQAGQVVREISIASPNDSPQSGPTILPLGDSITDGYSTPGGYRIKLDQDFGGNVQFLGSQTNGPSTLPDKHNEGHSGYRIDQIDGDLNGIVSSSPASPDTTNGGYWLTGGNGTGRSAIDPQYVLLHIGTNDATQGASASLMESRLIQLLGDLKTDLPTSQVIVASLIPRTDSAADEAVEEQYNAAMPAIVAEMGANFHFLDMHDVIDPSTDLADGVHPNLQGYDKMGDAWYGEIQAISVPEPTMMGLVGLIALAIRRRQ